MQVNIPLVDTRALIQEALAQGLDPHTYVAAKMRGCEMQDVTRAERMLSKQLNYVHLYSANNMRIFSGASKNGQNS